MSEGAIPYHGIRKGRKTAERELWSLWGNDGWKGDGYTPTKAPTAKPTYKPTDTPTSKPSNSPTRLPTKQPTPEPTNDQVLYDPTATPTSKVKMKHFFCFDTMKHETYVFQLKRFFLLHEQKNLSLPQLRRSHRPLLHQIITRILLLLSELTKPQIRKEIICLSSFINISKISFFPSLQKLTVIPKVTSAKK